MAVVAKNGCPATYIECMLPLAQKLLLLPKLARLGASAPKDPHVAWDQFWERVQRTGAGSDVLWDSGDDHEFSGYLERLRSHLDPALPIVDVGCGHGSFTRLLAGHFPQAIGVDVSLHAVRRARAASPPVLNTSFREMDFSAAEAGNLLRAEIGEANVFVRGVFHVLNYRAQKQLTENLYRLVGTGGRVFLAETNFAGNGLDYVRHLGATPQHIPAPLERAISSLPRPGHFGPKERQAVFSDQHWTTLVDGPTTIEAVPMQHTDQTEKIPGYFAVLAARPASA